MDPPEILPSELWYHIYGFLSPPDLLLLWKTHTYFKDSLTTRLQRLKKKSYGIELINNSKDQTSVLTTYRLIDGPNNLLLPGIYHLRFDIKCDLPPEDHMFILFGDIRIITHEHKIFLQRGILFGCVQSYLHHSKFSFLVPATTQLSLDVDLPTISYGTNNDVFIFHCIGSSTADYCHFEWYSTQERDGQWIVIPPSQSSTLSPTLSRIVWDPNLMTYIFQPITS